MSIADWTSNRWVTCFSDVGEQLLKRSAQEIGEIIDNNPPEAEELFSTINFHSYVFKIRSKIEIYGVSVNYTRHDGMFVCICLFIFAYNYFEKLNSYAMMFMFI